MIHARDIQIQSSPRIDARELIAVGSEGTNVLRHSPPAIFAVDNNALTSQLPNAVKAVHTRDMSVQQLDELVPPFQSWLRQPVRKLSGF